MTPARRLMGELLGTALLLAAVVGSGIMGDRLSGGNVAIALLANTLATGAMLVTLIFTFGAVSGAHFNPAVTLADASQGGMRWGDVPGYIVAQAAGAILGVWVAHLMFAEPMLQVSQHVRAGGSQLLSEFVATFGLLSVIWGCGRLRAESSRNPGTVFHEYVRRHQARRCSWIYGCPTCGGVRCHLPVSMAGAVFAQTGARRCTVSHRRGTFTWQIRNECSSSARGIRPARRWRKACSGMMPEIVSRWKARARSPARFVPKRSRS